MVEFETYFSLRVRQVNDLLDQGLHVLFHVGLRVDEGKIAPGAYEIFNRCMTVE